MQPSLIQAAGWDQISRLMVYLYLFTGLGLTAVFSFLLARAIVPSLVDSGAAPRLLLALRWPLLALFVAAAALATYACWTALGLAATFIEAYYPKVLI